MDTGITNETTSYVAVNPELKTVFEKFARLIEIKQEISNKVDHCTVGKINYTFKDVDKDPMLLINSEDDIFTGSCIDLISRIIRSKNLIWWLSSYKSSCHNQATIYVSSLQS